MKLDEETLEEIEELAEEVSDLYWSGERFDPQEALSKNNVLLIRDDFEDAFDGLLHYENGAFSVFCNSQGRSEARQRFTLGHELGHFFIPRHRLALIKGILEHPSHCDYTSNSVMEREADYFSSNLLMPKRRLLKAARRLPKGLSAVKYLAGKFGTSLTAAAIRYLDLYLQDGVLIMWSPEGEYRWRRLPNDQNFSIWTGTIKSKSELVPGSATEKVFNGKADPDKDIHSQGTTKSCWFQRIRQGSSNDDVCVEEVMQIGRYGYLTLVTPVNIT